MLEEGPSTHVSCNREEGLDFYKKMQVVRRMEASANNMYKSKLIRGFCHLYSGQVSLVSIIKSNIFIIYFLIGSCLCWYESSNG
jgi:pyruvate dehydrogenase E1 component alpha subunit